MLLLIRQQVLTSQSKDINIVTYIHTLHTETETERVTHMHTQIHALTKIHNTHAYRNRQGYIQIYTGTQIHTYMHTQTQP